MKDYLKSITGFNLPNQFIEIATKFQDRFGSKEDAIEKIGEYIGFDYIVDINEVRGYEGVPFEAELPFATGSNGELFIPDKLTTVPEYVDHLLNAVKATLFWFTKTGNFC